MSKQNNDSNSNIKNILNKDAAGKVDKKGNKFMLLSDINKHVPEGPGTRVVFAQPWTDKAFLSELQENNKKPSNKKIYWIFGDNTQDKSEALDPVKKNEKRKGTGNQAAALEGATHEEYSKVAIGVVTTKKPQGKELSVAFKDSLEELYEKAATEKNVTFIVPAEFDKAGNLTQINIGTGIAAKHLAPESVKAMTEAVKEVLTNIAKGERQPVPHIELKPKENFIQKAKQTFKKVIQNLFEEAKTVNTRDNASKDIEKKVRFSEEVSVAKNRTVNKQITKLPTERVASPPRTIINPNRNSNNQNRVR